MKINAICMVKNEADVLIETLHHALTFCDNIYVFDNGSNDGTWEKLQAFVKQEPRVIIAARSDEVFKEQLRNRVYNQYHHLFSAKDWWYILDADEMLAQDPRPMLKKAMQAGKQQMRMWQAQFYFTDKDAEQYATEDHSKAVAQRRRYYRINWREPRFFLNSPEQKWPETVSGRVPPFCKKLYRPSPICCHYANRTPEQIQQRRKIRINNPAIFIHVQRQNANDWMKKSADLFYFEPTQDFRFPLLDQLNYYRRECGFWCSWRIKSVLNLVKKYRSTKLLSQ
jgi:glycosyltransferase involved in cell wall biosynthesis